MVDKNFCMSSYLSFRHIWKSGVDFYPNLKHKNYVLHNKKDCFFVKTASDIDTEIQKQINYLYSKYSSIGVLLSGGMDSAIVASYLKPGSHAYTFSSKKTNVYDLEKQRAEEYVKKYKLVWHLVDIDFNDYKKYTPIVMSNRNAPVHSIEPQIYKAALAAKEDGVEIVLIGDAADFVFGGLDKLLSKDWKYDEFVKRYAYIDPKTVLNSAVDVNDVFLPYKKGQDEIDFCSFLQGPCCMESYESYKNAFDSAKIPYYDPYEKLIMKDKLDLKRIRNGESKYLIRELFKIKYPEFDVPEKIPMPRPVDFIFKNWEGPKRPEFREDIDMTKLSGNQKWLLWCLEQFLNIYD